MIRKCAAVPRFRMVAGSSFFFTILAGAVLQAQQTPSEPPPAPSAPAPAQPAAQTPDSQSSSSQEATPEDTTRRKVKLHDYKNWTVNVGGGASLENGTTKTYVRGGGGVIAAGVARNYSKYFWLRADFPWANRPLRSSALQLAPAPGATRHVYSLMLDPTINIPVTKRYGGYVLIGPSYYHRSGKLDSSTAIPGPRVNGFLARWGPCPPPTPPLTPNCFSPPQPRS